MAKQKYKDEDAKRPQPVARDGPYVMMLFLTLVAIATGCVLMYLDADEYSSKTPPAATAPAPQKLGDPFKDPSPPTPVAPPAPAPDPMGGGGDPMGMPPMPMGMMP
jgi:hypothetical protein